MTLAARPLIPGTRFAERLERAAAGTAAAGAGRAAHRGGSDLRYLTGYEAMPLERLTVLVLVAGQDPFIVVPRLERGAAESGLRTAIEIRTWDETDDPYAMVAQVVDATQRPSVRIGLSDTMIALHVLRLQAAIATTATYDSASSVLRELRMIKDADEIALLRLAAQAADRVVGQIASGRLVGRTEADVAREVRERLVAEGHEEAHFAIVGSGPNSASPHHEASERVIEAVSRSCSTSAARWAATARTSPGRCGSPAATRTRALTSDSATCSRSSTAPRRRPPVPLDPGIACAAVDAAARTRIDAEGYGEAFFHRTGHGIGLEGHEDPYLVAGNDLPLRPGMAFSVEPGIYFPGEYGARIEDIVVCGEDGPVVLNEAPRELYVVEG